MNRSAILNAGYRVSQAHASPHGFKTDAPSHVIWDIMRAWNKENPTKRTNTNSPAHAILSKEIKYGL